MFAIVKWLPCKATRTVMFIKAETSIRIMQIYEIFPICPSHPLISSKTHMSTPYYTFRPGNETFSRTKFKGSLIRSRKPDYSFSNSASDSPVTCIITSMGSPWAIIFFAANTNPSSLPSTLPSSLPSSIPAAKPSS